MKEFGKTLKQLFQVNMILGEMIQYALITAGGSVLGTGIVLVVLRTNTTDNEYMKAGNIMALLLGAIVFLFMGILAIKGDFNLAIGMGKTRKNYVVARYLLSMLNVLIILGIVWITGTLEGGIYKVIYPNSVCRFDLGELLFRPQLVLGILLALPAVILLLGVLLLKYGKIAFWVLWCIWMVGCLGIPRIMAAVVEHPDSLMGRFGEAVIKFFMKASLWGVFGVLAGIAVVAMTVTIYVIRNQQVTA